MPSRPVFPSPPQFSRSPNEPPDPPVIRTVRPTARRSSMVEVRERQSVETCGLGDAAAPYPEEVDARMAVNEDFVGVAVGGGGGGVEGLVGCDPVVADRLPPTYIW